MWGALSVHQGRLSLYVPGNARSLCLDVSDLEIVGGRLSSLGSVTMSARLRQDGNASKELSQSVGAGGANTPKQTTTAPERDETKQHMPSGTNNNDSAEGSGRPNRAPA